MRIPIVPKHIPVTFSAHRS